MKMQHVTIMSAAYDKSIEFYRDICGLSVQAELKGGTHNITFLGSAESETAVEIIDSPGDAYSGKGISMGFACENVERYREELADKGYNPTEIIRPNPKVAFFFVEDPNGVRIQFI